MTKATLDDHRNGEHPPSLAPASAEPTDEPVPTGEPVPTRSLLGRVSGGLGDQVRRRLPAAGLDDRDPDYIREQLPLLWLFSTLWFRGEVRGLGNIPDGGPVLLVANRSGGSVAPETHLFTLAFSTYFGSERPFYGLTHRLLPGVPGLRPLRRFGAIQASDVNAHAALRAGAALLVQPGGDREAHRPSWRRHRVELGPGKGYLRLALEHDVPLVPVVAVGAHETALFLTGGERLARVLGLRRFLGIPMLPLSLAAPWGLNVGDLLGHIPLPAKITVEVLPAIDLRAEFGESPDLDELHAHVSRVMQEALDALADERRWPVLG